MSRKKCPNHIETKSCVTQRTTLYNYTCVNSHVLVINPFPQNLSVLVGTPFSRGSGIITKSCVQLAPDSATKSVPIEAIIKYSERMRKYLYLIIYSSLDL